MSAPSFANRSAIARPMPCPAPVMRATFPLMLMFISLIGVFVAAFERADAVRFVDRKLVPERQVARYAGYHHRQRIVGQLNG